MNNNKNKSKNKNKSGSAKDRFGGNGNAITRAPLAVTKNINSNIIRTRVTQRERVLTIAGNTTFGVVASLAVNPGLSAAFPWLATQAALYEKYIVHSIRYRYRTLKGANQPGNITLGFDYDVLDASPDSAVTMTQLGIYNDGAVWDIFDLIIPGSSQELFIRSGVVGGDLKTYDYGKLYISAEGCTDTSAHGYLEVEYDVSFVYKNRNVNSLSNSTTASWMMRTDLAPEVVAPGAAIPWRSPVSNQYGIVVSPAFRFTLPAGNWLVSVALQTSAGVIDAPIHHELETAFPYSVASVPVATMATSQFLIYSSGVQDGFWIENVFAATYISFSCVITFTPV